MSNIQKEINRLTQAKTDIKGVLDRLSVSYESDKLDSLASAIGSIKKVEAKQENGVITIPAGYISEEQTFVVSSDLTTGYLINGADGNVYFQAVKEVDGEIVADGDPVKVEGIEIPDTGVDAPSPVYPLPEDDIVTGYIVNNEDGSVYFQRVKEVDGEITNDGYPVLISEANIPETGVDEPEYVCDSPATSGCEFYKCASVDTTAKTWTGYKAVLTDGSYSFEKSVTPGLTYEDSYIPTVGRIYSEDTLIQVQSMFSKYAWSSPDNLISNTSNPEFIVEESSRYSSNTIAYKAFDGSMNVGNYSSGTYNSADYVTTAELTITLDAPKEVNYIKLVSAGYSNGCQPASFNLEYSDNKTDWIPCLEVEGLTKAWWNTPAVGAEHEWSCNSSGGHQYYRLNMLTRTDGVSYNIQRMEIGMK